MASPIDARVRRNILSLYLVQLANLIVPLVTLPYLARVLGTRAFGDLAFAQALTMYLVLLTDWGFALSGPQQLLRTANDSTPARILSDVLSAKVLLLGLSALLLEVTMPLGPSSEEHRLLRWAAWLSCVGNVATLGWVLQAYERLELYAMALLVGRVLTTPLVFLFVQTPKDAWVAALIASASTVVSGIVTWRYVRHLVPAPATFSLSGALTQLKQSADIFTSTVAISAYTFGSTVVLGVLTNANQVAIFGSADRVRGAVQGFVTPINQALFPRANQAAGDRGSIRTFLAHALAFQVVITGCMTVFLIALAPTLIHVLFGKSFSAAIPVLRILALLPVIVGTSNVFGIQGLIPLGLKRIFSRILIVTAVLSLVSLVPAARQYGPTGVAWVTVAAEAFVVIAMGVALFRELAKPRPGVPHEA